MSKLEKLAGLDPVENNRNFLGSSPSGATNWSISSTDRMHRYERWGEVSITSQTTKLKIMKYTEIVLRGDNVVRKISVDEVNAYYSVGYDGKSYKFVVPLNDVGSTKLLDEDKTTYFARWIRKSLEANLFVEIV